MPIIGKNSARLLGIDIEKDDVSDKRECAGSTFKFLGKTYEAKAIERGDGCTGCCFDDVIFAEACLQSKCMDYCEDVIFVESNDKITSGENRRGV